MANQPVNSDNLPPLSAAWLRMAEGIAVHSLGFAPIGDVPPEHREHVLTRTCEGMEALEVTPPANRRSDLIRQCGWASGEGEDA